MDSKIRLGVVFGSRSVEHEVSIVTAAQLMENVNRQRYELIPFYIDKQGRWWTGEALTQIATFRSLDLQNPEKSRTDLTPVEFSPDPTKDHGIDAAIFCTHGGHGEDGTLAGLFELAEIPYAAPGIVAAAVSIDKIITKHVMAAAGVPVTKYEWFTAEEWADDRKGVLQTLQQNLSYPMFIKPATLGSSVGVSRATDEKSLRDSIDLAVSFDSRVIVEQEATDCIEVNVSVIGTLNEYEVSMTEQPIRTDAFLSYADKYERGGGKKTGGSKGMAGLSRRIPAPITTALGKEIQEAARKVWHLIGGTGVARIDFFANPSTEEIFLGEINAPPGSMAYYLWEATGRNYPELIEHLVDQALKRSSLKRTLMHSIESNILAEKK